MPKHCILNFNNPVTGRRHSSLLGYIMNQQGLDVTDVNALLENFYALKSFQNSNDLIKSGVSELFESNPELASIGTPQQYSQYLDSIFPDSKVKDIVYHGTNNKNFTPKEAEQGIHFGFKKYVEEWMYRTNAPFNQRYYKIKDELEQLDEGDFSEKFGLTREELEEEFNALSNRGTYYIPAILNIKNPKETTYKAYNWQQDIKDAKKTKNDGLVYSINKDVVDTNFLEGQNQIVFEPSQIHILGNKEDLAGFRQFVNQEKLPSSLSEKTWGSNTNSNTDFIEPRISDLVTKYDLQIVPGLVDQINLIQDFYDSKNLNIDTDLNILQAIELIKEAQGLGISLEVEIVNPEDAVSDRIYRIYPANDSEKLNDDVNKFLYAELRQQYERVGLGETLDRVSGFVNVLNPNIPSMLKSFLNDPSTTAFEKDILNTMLGLLEQFPEIEINFSKDIAYSEINPDNIVPAKYNSNTNTITFYIGALSDYTPTQFRHLLLHELSHPLLFSTLKNPKTPAEKVFANEIKRIYSYYRQKYPNTAYIDDFYGLQNEHEFLAEFLSNPEFRKLLSEETPEVHGSVFQSLINFFTKLFRNFLGKSNRTDVNYLKDLTAYLYKNVLDTSLNTTLLYTGDESFNYEKSDTVYNDFLKSFPGKNTLDKFYKSLESLLNDKQLNWQSVYQHAKATGIQLKRFTASQEALENLEVNDVVRSDLKTSFTAVMTHLSETALFLRSMKASLTELQKNESLPEHVLFRRAYHAKNIGEHYKKYIEDFKSLMDNPSSGSPLGRHIYNIEALAQELIDGFDSIAAPAIASKFADYFWPQTEEIKKGINQRIAELQNTIDIAIKAGNTKKAQVFQEELEKEKQALKRIATKENLEAAFKGVLTDGDNTQTLGSRLGAFIESAALSGDLVAGSLAGFVDDLYSQANEEAIVLESNMKSLADRLQKHLEKQGIRAVTSLSYNDVFAKYVRRVTIKEIKRINGVLELVERETYVFQTAMDEVSYLNDYNSRRIVILKLENKENKSEEDIKELEKLTTELAQFEEQHLEGLYTEEYHRIQGLLSDAAREARQQIIDQMRQIQINATQGDQTDEDLDILEDLKRQLDELENPFGKSPEQQEIAYNIQAWKEAKQNADLFVYQITDENRAIFEDSFNTKKAKVLEAQYELAALLGISQAVPNLAEEISKASAGVVSDRVQVAKQQLKFAEEDLIKFKRNNVVRKIAPEFYEERSTIIDAIKNIQSKYITNPDAQKTIDELYKELFSLLKAYKNADGEYVGSKVPTELVEFISEDGTFNKSSIALRVRELENELEQARESMLANSTISPEDKKNINELFGLLNNMQKRTNTEDYNRKVKEEQAKARTAVVAELGEKINTMTTVQINRAVLLKYRASEWYLQNHRDFKPDGQGTPLFHWRITMPTNTDYILEEEPSFRWYTIEVNDAVNPDTGKPLYINKDVKNFKYSKRVPLKATSTYQNAEYTKLDLVEREIIESVLAELNAVEDGLPNRLKLGVELPAYQKTGLEGLNGKVGRLKDQIKGVAKNLWDKATGEDSNEDPTSKVSLLDKLNTNKSELNKYSDRIHLKYVSPIEADRMSINFFESVTQFGADAIRFKKLYQNMAYIFGARDLVNKNLSGTTAASVVNNLIERKLNGKSKVSLTGNPWLNLIGYVSDKAIVGLTAKVTLSVNLPSALKNFMAGSYNIYTQANRFGLDVKDIAIGKATAAKHLRDFYRSSIESGVSTPYIQKIRYFNVMPEDHLSNTGKRIYRTSLEKTDNFNPGKMYGFLRESLEFEMRVAVAEALSKQHLIELQNGQFIPIMDAYTTVNGLIVPRADIKDLSSFPAQENYFKGRLNLINSLIHGAYGAMDKPEYQRYAIGRFIMMMRNWFGYQWLSRFGSRRMSIRAGIEFEGMYRTVWNVLGYKGKYWQLMSYSATSELLSQREKENLKSAMFDTLGISLIMGISYLISQAVYSDDDEDVDNSMAYLMLYNLLYLEDELNTLHPVLGPTAIGYSRIQNKVSGDSFATYYFKKYFTEPFRVTQDIGRAAIEYSPFGDLGMFDEYVPLSKSGKVMNPNRYKPDPFLEGMPDIIARTLKLLSLDKSVNFVIGNQEFMYRKYDYLNPKYFTESYEKELREAKRDQRSNKLEIKAIKEELNYIEDPDTKALLYEKIDSLESEIASAKEEQSVLQQEYSDYMRADRK